MSIKPALATITNDILEKLNHLTESESFVRTTDNVLSEFEFKSFMRKADQLPELSERYLVKALLHLNYNLDVELAISWFDKSILLNSNSLTAWTHFPACLSARGFISHAAKYFRDANNYLVSKLTIFNVFSSSIDTRDWRTCFFAAEEFCKRYPSSEEREDWIDGAFVFAEKAKKQSLRLKLNDDAIVKALISIQSYLGSLGFLVKSVRHFFDDYREESFIIYEICNLSDELVDDLNLKVTDFIVDNNLWNLKFTLVINNRVEDHCEI